MTNTKLSPPWAIFYREVEALFKNDPEIHITYNEETLELKLYVDNPTKADALMKLLPRQKDFGNVSLHIAVIPADRENIDNVSIYQQAFEGNPALSYATSTQYPAYPADYIVFKKEVVQYFNDSLADINGLCSTLYEDLARDVFGDNAGVYFCTDNK